MNPVYWSVGGGGGKCGSHLAKWIRIGMILQRSHLSLTPRELKELSSVDLDTMLISSIGFTRKGFLNGKYLREDGNHSKYECVFGILVGSIGFLQGGRARFLYGPTTFTLKSKGHIFPLLFPWNSFTIQIILNNNDNNNNGGVEVVAMAYTTKGIYLLRRCMFGLMVCVVTNCAHVA